MVADGDSITTGFGAFPYTNSILLDESPQRIANVAVFGETLATMLANAPTDVDPLHAPNGNNIVIIWGGTNDITLGATPAATYANLTSYIEARHAIGWKVIAVTMLSRFQQEAGKNAYNALILANSAGADGIADFTATPLGIDGGWANPVYFQADGVHPTSFGVSSVIVPVMQAAVDVFQ